MGICPRSILRIQRQAGIRFRQQIGVLLEDLPVTHLVVKLHADNVDRISQEKDLNAALAFQIDPSREYALKCFPPIVRCTYLEELNLIQSAIRLPVWLKPTLHETTSQIRFNVQCKSDGASQKPFIDTAVEPQYNLYAE